jgi:hypothetical protein
LINKELPNGLDHQNQKEIQSDVLSIAWEMELPATKPACFILVIDICVNPQVSAGTASPQLELGF